MGEFSDLQSLNCIWLYCRKNSPDVSKEDVNINMLNQRLVWSTNNNMSKEHVKYLYAKLAVGWIDQQQYRIAILVLHIGIPNAINKILLG